MRINKTKTDCCGCTACESVCPHRAIRMVPDTFGFLYPEVDDSLCVDCGLCEKVCAFHGDYDRSLNLVKPLAYAAKHKNPEEIAASQSGAAFVALSDFILSQGGVVYGAGYTGHFRVVHKKAETRAERDEFRGSKYVQSDMNTVFGQVREDLNNGLLVLFSGTPCQTAGLSSFVGKRLQDRLFLMDIVCHGVPGPFIWRDYLDYLEAKEGMRITAVNFRDKKRFGWRSHVESFLFANTCTNTYTNTFYTHIMLRRSCGECPYTNTHRPSDITVADFWGIENTSAADLGADNKGCSLILVNTDKGENWFEQVKGNMEYKAIPLEDCLQPQLCHPSILHPERIAFEKDYARLGFERTLKKYGLLGWKAEVKAFRRRLVGFVLGLLSVGLKQNVKKVIRRK